MKKWYDYFFFNLNQSRVPLRYIGILANRDAGARCSGIVSLDIAGLPRQIRRDTLIIPDPNDRVQAVIDGQGIALMDSLIQRELDEKLLFRLSEQELSEYGYFIACPRPNVSAKSIEAFVEWLKQNE